jgi:hypothetical protein
MKTRWIDRPFDIRRLFKAFSPTCRGQRRSLATLSLVEILEERCLLTPVAWTANTDGFWDVGTNWSTGLVPGPSDDVIIDRGAFNPIITVRDDRQVHSFISRESLVLTSGTLRADAESQIDASTATLLAGSTLFALGPVTITNSGSLDWQGGTILGQGLVNSGTITVSSPTDVRLSGTLTNNHTMVYSGAGSILLDGSTKLINSAGALFDIAGDGDFAESGITGGFTAFFQNDGTLRKSAGTGVSMFNDIVLHSSSTGVFDVESGRLNASSTGNWDGSTFTGGPDGVLEISGNYVVSGNLSATGNGHLELTGTVNSTSTGAILNFPAGYFQWLGGAILSNGVGFANSGSLTIPGPSDVRLAGTFTNNGTMTDSSAGFIRMGGSTKLINSAGALFDFAGDGDFGQSGIGGGFGPFLQNDGTLRKSAGAGVSEFDDIALNNSATGVLDVQAGRLKASSTGTWTGGTLNTGAAGVFEISGSYGISGTLAGSGTGHVALTGTLSSTTPGATLNFPSGYFQWLSGALVGSGAGITNTGFITITGDADVRIGSTLINSGTIVQSGDKSLLFGGSTKLINNAGAVYDLAGDGDFGQSGIGGGFAPFFQNDGTFRKSAGSDVSILDGDQLVNSAAGVIDLLSGRLKLATNSAWTGGTINAAANAVFEIGADLRVDGTLTGSGAGHVELTASLTTLGAGTTLNFPGDFFQWLSGRISAGPVLTNVGTMNLSGPLGKSFDRANLVNTGNVVISGAGGLSVDATITNQPGGIIELQGAVKLAEGTITNSGMIIKTGAGDAVIDSNLVNTATGVIDVEADQLTLSRGGALSGTTFHVNAGSKLSFTGSQVFNLAGNYDSTGPGVVEFHSLMLGNATTPARLNFALGTLSMSEGQLLGNIINDGWFAITTPTGLFTRAVITNNGTWVHSGAGDFVMNANTRFVNNGLYDLQTDADLVVPNDGSNTTMNFLNLGVFRKSGGVGTSALRHDGNFKEIHFDNSGTVEVRTGTLSINDSVGQASGTTLAGGTWIVDAFCTLTMPGSGIFTLNRGNVVLDGQAANFTNFVGLSNNQGSFTLTHGGIFPTPGALANSGNLTVGPSSLLTVNGNLTEASIPGLVGWWRGDGDATDATTNGNGTLVGDTTFGAGQFGQAFSFDGTGDLVNVGNPAALRVQNFTITAYVKRDDVSKSGQIFGYGTSGYGFGMFADGTLFLTQSGVGTARSSSLKITDTDFHQVAVTNEGSKVTFYVDGVPELVAPLLSSFNFFTNAAIGGRADSADPFWAFQGRIDEVAVFSRALTAAEIQTLATTNNPVPIGNLPATINMQIGGRPPTGDFGKINVTGVANLTGGLNIQTVDGFGPVMPDQYPILTYNSRSGTFAPIGGLNPFYDVAIGPAQTVVSVVASAADIAVQNITVPETAAPGGPVTIQYTVQNLDNVNVVGSWFDSIYLSTDGTYDPSDPLIGRVEHVGGLGALSSYLGSLTATLPGVVDGNYHVIVIADSRGNVGDSDRTNNTLASTDQITVNLPVLAFATSTPLTIDNNQDIYLRLDVPVGGDVLITANFQNALQGEFFVRQGTLPTRSDFDFVASNLSDLSRTITLVSPQAGPYYILFHGREGAAGGVILNVLAQNIAFNLQSVSPNRGSNRGQATTDLIGSGFTSDTVVELLDGTGNSIATATARLISQNRLYATFNLVGIAAGTYAVRASRLGFTDTLPAAYQVVVGDPGAVRVDVVIPGSVRGGLIYTGYIEYKNVGDTDVLPPVIFVDSTTKLTFDLDQSPSIGEYRFLAISPEGPAGILAPGQSVRVPFRIVGDNATIEASSMSPDETALMDWDALRTAIRPDDAPAGWDTIFTQQFVGAGSTVGDYVRLLAQAATLYQTRNGFTTSNPNTLNGFLMGEGFADREAVIVGHVFRDDLQHAAGDVVVSAVNQMTGIAYAAISTADGLLRMPSVPPGTYDIHFEDVIPPANLAPLIVPAVGLPAEQTWLVTSGGTITGRVGVPVGVVLNNFNTGTVGTVIARDVAGNRYTAGVDENRVYKFTGLPTGLYELSFSTPTTVPVTIENVNVVEGHVTGFIDLFSALGGMISGTVRDAHTNHPVPNLTVTTSDPINPRIAVTDVNGNYLLQGVSPGIASVKVASEGVYSVPVSGVVVNAGATKTNLDLTADFSFLATVSGTVTFNGLPLAGAVVKLFQDNTVIAGATTDENGTYQLHDIIPGDYQLTATDPETSPSTQSISLAVFQTLLANFTMVPGASIHGVLTYSANGQFVPSPHQQLELLEPSGDLVPLYTSNLGEFFVGHLDLGTYQLMLADGSHRQSFEITSTNQNLDLSFNLNTGVVIGQLFQHDGTTPADRVIVGIVSNGQVVETTTTLSNGYFAVTYVDPGTYEIAFEDPNVIYSKISNVIVPAGGYVDLGEIHPQTASLSLSLTDATGNNIDDDGGVFLSQLDDPLGGSIALRHTASGAQMFDGLVPGRYLIQAVLEHFALTQTTIDVVAGANVQSLVVTTGALVNGTVTDASNTPLSGITVILYDPAKPEIQWRAQTDAAGKYVQSVPAGAYTVVFTDLRTDDGIVHLAQATLLNVATSNGQTLTLDEALVPGSATLTGTINAGNANPVDSAPLGATVTLLTTVGVPVAIASSDDHGVYQFTRVLPGNYQLQVASLGFSFAPLNITLQAGVNAGVNPQGKWVLPSISDAGNSQPAQIVQPNSVTALSLSNDDVVTFSEEHASTPFNFQQFVSDAEQKLNEIFHSLIKQPHPDLKNYGGGRDIDPECPDAVAAFQTVLRDQLQANILFANWIERWDTARETFATNVESFTFEFVKFLSSLVIVGKLEGLIEAGTKEVATLLSRNKEVANGLAQALASAEETGIPFRKENYDVVLGFAKQLGTAFEKASNVLSLTIRGDGLAALEGATKEALDKVHESVEAGTSFGTMLEALTTLRESHSFAEFNHKIGEIAEFGSTAFKVAEAVSGFVNIVLANPALSKFAAVVGPLSDGLSALSAATRGIKDVLADATTVNEFKEAYESAIKRRDEAFEKFLQIYAECIREHSKKTGEPHTPVTLDDLRRMFIKLSSDPNDITGPDRTGRVRRITSCGWTRRSPLKSCLRTSPTPRRPHRKLSSRNNSTPIWTGPLSNWATLGLVTRSFMFPQGLISITRESISVKPEATSSTSRRALI